MKTKTKLALGAGPYNWVEVGTSKDGCTKACDVRVPTGVPGVEAQVAAGQATVQQLPGFTTEFHWYCCGTRERVANGNPFNGYRCERAGNGAIAWTFYAIP